MGRFLWAILVIVQATGCVLVVPSFDHTDHCNIGGTTTCATCLRQKCQPPIDTCCGDPKCNGGDGHTPLFDGLDACGGGDQAGCAQGLLTADSANASAVGSCVTTSCKKECVGDAVASVPWSCKSMPAAELPCAKCVFDACKTDIASCCEDASCQTDSALQEDIAACTGTDSPKCYYRLAHADTNGLAAKVRACIAKECEVNCLGSSPRPHETCNYRANGSYCSCGESESASGPPCPGTMDFGTCVLGTGGCTCGRYACTSSSTSHDCSCNFNGDLTGNTESCSITRDETTGEGICCMKYDSSGPSCACDSFKSSCYMDESEVSSCDLTTLMPALQSASALVSSCSN